MSRTTVSKTALARALQCFADKGITPAKVRLEPGGIMEFVLADGESLTSEGELAELERQQERVGQYGKRRKVPRQEEAGAVVLLDTARQRR